MEQLSPLHQGLYKITFTKRYDIWRSLGLGIFYMEVYFFKTKYIKMAFSCIIFGVIFFLLNCWYFVSSSHGKNNSKTDAQIFFCYTLDFYSLSGYGVMSFHLSLSFVTFCSKFLNDFVFWTKLNFEMILITLLYMIWLVDKLINHIFLVIR